MPIELLQAYIAMMPVLKAQERLISINDMQIAYGSIKKHSAESILKELEEMAGSRAVSRTVENRDVKNIQLQSLGFEVIDLRKNKDA